MAPITRIIVCIALGDFNSECVCHFLPHLKTCDRCHRPTGTAQSSWQCLGAALAGIVLAGIIIIRVGTVATTASVQTIAMVPVAVVVGQDQLDLLDFPIPKCKCRAHFTKTTRKVRTLTAVVAYVLFVVFIVFALFLYIIIMCVCVCVCVCVRLCVFVLWLCVMFSVCLISNTVMQWKRYTESHAFLSADK